MNKLFLRIATAFAGMAMAIGVGVGISQSSGFERVEAAAGSNATGTANNWVAISSAGDISTSADYLIGYEYDGTKYFATGASGLATSATVTSCKLVRLVAATNGYYITTSSGKYIRNNSSTTVSWGSTVSDSDWILSLNDGIYEITNTSNSNRYLSSDSAAAGVTIKAYASNSKRTTNIPATLYKYVETSGPELTVSTSSLKIGVGLTNSFTVTTSSLTAAFTVTSGNTSKVTVASISPAASKDDGTYTVTLNGVATTDSAVTVTVASSGATSRTVSVSVVNKIQKITGALKNGTYSFVSTTYGMKNTISSNRLQNDSASVSGNYLLDTGVTTWKVRKTSDGYFTIQDTTNSKYAAGNESDNQAALLNSITDYAKWTVDNSTAESNGTYDFINYGRHNADAEEANLYLRNNTTSGWGCYASGTGRKVSLYGSVEDSLTLSKTSSNFDDDKTDTVTLGVVNNTAVATYQATSNDTGVCTVGIAGTTLTLTGVAAGTTTVDVVLKIGGVATDWGTIDVEVNSTESVKSISIKADGVDKTGETVSLMQGNSLELSYAATNNSDLPWTGAVTYTLSSTTYATIEDNVVTARTTTTGGPTTVTVKVDSDPSKSASFTLNVTAWTGALTINSYYVLANMSDNDHPSELTGIANSVGTATAHHTYVSTSYPLKVVAGNTYNSYAFMTNEVDGEDHPYYLYHTGSSNTLSKTTTLDNKASWTVSVSNGEYTITNVADSRVIQYNMPTGENPVPRFAAYTSASNDAVRLIEIDSTVKVQGFVEAYMHTEISTSTRTDTTACYGTDGTDGYFAKAKAALDSDFYSPIASTFATSPTYADYWERYVAWGANCKVIVTYSGGVQYNAINISHTQLFEQVSNSQMLAIVVVATAISLLAVGGYFFLRRKQH